MVTASVVTYHTSMDDLDKLMVSIQKSSIDHVYIIDNSNDEALRPYFKNMPKVEYIKNQNNGYGAGHNIGIRKAIECGSKYHVVINPDIFWDEPVIEKLTKFMDENPVYGIAMPIIKDPEGNMRYVCRLIPSPSDLIIRRFIPFKSLKDKKDNIYQMKWTGYNRRLMVPTISGCFMFMRLTTLKNIGGFDERFFMYLEDVDLSRRMGTIAENVLYPECTVYHVADWGSRKNMKMFKYHMKSAFKYFNKWGWFFDSERRRINKIAKKQ